MNNMDIISIGKTSNGQELYKGTIYFSKEEVDMLEHFLYAETKEIERYKRLYIKKYGEGRFQIGLNKENIRNHIEDNFVKYMEKYSDLILRVKKS